MDGNQGCDCGMKARNRGRIGSMWKWIITRWRGRKGRIEREFSRWTPSKLTEIDGSNHRSVFRHSSDHVRPRLYPRLFGYAFIRVSHSATTHWTNIYGVRTVRGILRRPSDEMFRSIITVGACAEYRGREGGTMGMEQTTTATPRRGRRRG